MEGNSYILGGKENDGFLAVTKVKSVLFTMETIVFVLILEIAYNLL